jgi:hypothetical protein
LNDFEKQYLNNFFVLNLDWQFTEEVTNLQMILSFTTLGGAETEFAIRTRKKPFLDAARDLKYEQNFYSKIIILYIIILYYKIIIKL